MSSSATRCSSSTRSWRVSASEHRPAVFGRDVHRPQQAREHPGVTEPDPRARQAAGVQRRHQDLEHVDRPRRRVCADQLDPGLEELALLPALRAHRPVGVGQVTEAQRRLRIGEPGRGQPRDRDRHVRAQRQHLPVLVEQAVARARRPLVAAHEHVLVLHRGRGDLAVPEPHERLEQRGRELAQLAHLVRQDVAGPGGDRVVHLGRVRQAAHHIRVRSSALRIYAETRSPETRSMRAPSSRNRSSMRS